MKNEILHTSNFLNELFMKNDSDFLIKSDDKTDEIKNIIIVEEQKRDTIVEYINNLNDVIASSDEDEILKDFLYSATKTFENFNEGINSLYSLKRSLNEIIQSTCDLLTSIETTNKDKNFYTDLISSIEEKIKKFTQKNDETISKINDINKKYKEFILQDKNKEYTKNIDKDTLLLKDFSDKFNLKIKSTTTQKLVSIPDNKNLIITEDYIYLPYTCSEINDYMQQYPDSYSSVDDVIKKEFSFPTKYYSKNTVLSRFRETYALIRDREAKSVIEALKLSFGLMFRYEINPAIIAACKSEDELKNYLECLENNKLNEFKRFKIKYEINPF